MNKLLKETLEHAENTYRELVSATPNSLAFKEDRNFYFLQIDNINKLLEIPSLEDQMKEFESDYNKLYQDVNYEIECGYYKNDEVYKAFEIWQIARGYVV